jgi:hypothetical protein
MQPNPNNGEPASGGEAEFIPAWLTWDEAAASLSYTAEREWLRRAREAATADDRPLTADRRPRLND